MSRRSARRCASSSKARALRACAPGWWTTGTSARLWRTATNSTWSGASANNFGSAEERAQELVAAEEIGNDVVGADTREALPLPVVDGQAFRLGRRHAHRHAA